MQAATRARLLEGETELAFTDAATGHATSFGFARYAVDVGGICCGGFPS